MSFSRTGRMSDEFPSSVKRHGPKRPPRSTPNRLAARLLVQGSGLQLRLQLPACLRWFPFCFENSPDHSLCINQVSWICPSLVPLTCFPAREELLVRTRKGCPPSCQKQPHAFWLASVATNTSLAGARLLCKRKVRHLRLVGHSAEHRCAWTRVAQVYPGGFCRVIAGAMCKAAGWSERRALDPSACAKLGCNCRVGEAKNPGPRHPTRLQRAAQRTTDLEGLPTLSATTLGLGARAWLGFLTWARIQK